MFLQAASVCQMNDLLLFLLLLLLKTKHYHGDAGFLLFLILYAELVSKSYHPLLFNSHHVSCSLQFLPVFFTHSWNAA